MIKELLLETYCQNDLPAALCEIGRSQRTLFIIEWILDACSQQSRRTLSQTP